MATYIGLVRKDKGSSFGVEFPDFPGCISAGESLDEAARGAREALELHIEGMVEDGEAIPDPSSLEAVRDRKEFANAVPLVVEVPVARGAKRINITMDEGLLEKIDERAAAIGTTRSGFIADAARSAIRGYGSEGAPAMTSRRR